MYPYRSRTQFNGLHPVVGNITANFVLMRWSKFFIYMHFFLGADIQRTVRIPVEHNKSISSRYNY